ncbi:MAG: adenylosuccinate synthase [Candidatus Thorarchaeota archaeon]|nr:adenylosuccinate synthase [Candidatus Thorarchaeota archaeon]
MQNLVVVGLQWGDEGKGKLVDYLSESFDIVARFQGGSNAGHTVKVGDNIYKFRIMPTGAIRGKKSVIGNGVVLDPSVLLDEITNLKAAGVKPDLLISDRAHLITPLQIEIDVLQESEKGDRKVGTTKRGIGPTYSDKASRISVRSCDLMDPSDSPQLDQLEKILSTRIERLYEYELDNSTQETFASFRSKALLLKKYIGDVGEYLHSEIENGKTILFEGAQGSLLDIDHGTYPFVTSSSCVSAAASSGTGVSPFQIGDVLGICKAYITRVGTGPFPTELSDDVGERIRKQGKEFGTVTGRPRRCGWLDLVALRYAVRINGAKFLAVTKNDVLNGINPLKVCVAYNFHGEEITTIPASATAYGEVIPIYEELIGWSDFQIGPEDVYDDLPGSLREYISYIENFAKSRVGILSVGPDRTDTIQVPGTPFEKFTNA